MNAKKILIVTEELDTHADLVILRLRELGHEPIRFHREDIPTRADFDLGLEGSRLRGELRTRKRTVALEDIRSIWWRRPRPSVLPPGLSEEEQAFARLELEHALNGLWSTLDCYWMSHPGNIRQADWKPGQLKRAAQLGLETPRTLLTNNPERALEFFHQCNGRMIFKVMSDPTLRIGRTRANEPKPLPKEGKPTGEGAYATLLKEEDLRKHAEKIRNTPCLFQEYVEKRVELRVTLIGDELFVAEIDSQAQERTRIDWRHYDVPMLMRAGSLPPEVAARCFALMKGYGLNFSAMDFIVTPDGRHVFLESNPNGQWQFVQHKVPELKMAEAVASCLIRGKS